MTAAMVAIWCLSGFRCFAVVHTRGTLSRNTQTPDGRMGAWEYTLTTLGIQTHAHRFRFIRAEYLSVMERESEQDRFTSQLGWRTLTFPRITLRPEYHPWFSFDRSGWSFPGLGAVRTVSGGQQSGVVDVPYWLLIVAFGAPLMLHAGRRRTIAWRAKTGRCLRCGYPLDAAMVRCPECGSSRDGLRTSDPSV